MVRVREIYGVVGLALCLFASHAAWAEPVKGVGRLSVVSAALHAEAPRAEMCLTLSAPIRIKDRNKIASWIDLSREGKSEKVQPSDLSLTPTELCVQNLKHRSHYELTLRMVEGEDKSKLDKPYALRFEVADRKPVLRFVTSENADVLPRHIKVPENAGDKGQELPSGMAHVVRSVNVLATHLTLFRVKDNATLPGAWQQFRQINLSPSESLTFAKSHGEQVFESDLVFGEAPNEEQTLVAPLPSDDVLQPGLYYLAATPRGKPINDPALLTGQWFLVSDLYVTASRVEDGVQVFASQAGDEMKPAQKADVSLLTPDGRVIASGQTQTDGSVFLPVTEEAMKEASVLIGRVESGGLDILDAGLMRKLASGSLMTQAYLSLDRDAYKAGETALITRRMEDRTGKILDAGDTVLRVFRSDKRLYREFPLPAQSAGVTSLALPLPVLGRDTLWKLVWSRKDGTVLAETSLPIKSAARGKEAKESGLLASEKEEGGQATESKKTSGLEVKPLHADRGVAENTIATFAVNMLDAAGRRRALGDLYYVIYEEGRRFEWFAAEGHWDYKPLPQLRRVGGGALTLSTSEDTLVAWPVTAGHYILDILEADGTSLGQYPFDAGRLATEAHREDGRLRFAGEKDQKLDVKKDNVIRFSLGEPAMVSVVVTDGQVRHAHHAFMKAGENTVTVLPAEMWGKQVLVSVEAQFSSDKRQAEIHKRLPVRKMTDDLVFKLSPPAHAISGQSLSLPVHVQAREDASAAFVGATVSFVAEQEGAYTPPVVLHPVALDGEGKASLAIDMPRLRGAATIRLMAWNDKQYGVAAVNLPVSPVLLLDGKALDNAAVGQKVSFPVLVTNKEAPAGTYDYSVTVPEGVEMSSPSKGKIKIASGGRAPLTLGFTPRQYIDGEIRIDIEGAEGVVASESWSLVARPVRPLALTQKTDELQAGQSLSLVREEGKGHIGQAVAFVTPVSLPEIGPLLVRLMDQKPQTTEDIALWLDAARQWGQALVKAGLVSERRLEQMRAARLETLQTRQNIDGGFSTQRSGDPSDLKSTALALSVLAGRVEPAGGLAAEWLALKLQNTWFDEEERGARAIAFAALAQSSKVDLSALRYFAQTSQDKNLDALGRASIAYALARVGDEAAARAQQALVASALGSLPDEEALPVLLRLAQTPLAVLPEAAARFEALDKQAVTDNSKQGTLLLSTLAYRQEKAGTWRLSVGGKEEKYFGLFPVETSKEPTEIKNLSDKTLYVTRLTDAPKSLDDVGR